LPGAVTFVFLYFSEFLAFFSMPTWTLKYTATKMLQNLSSNTAPRERKGSIDIHVHTQLQRPYFVETANNHATCDPVGHRRFVAPYSLPPKYEKEFSGSRPKPRPKPLSTFLSPCLFPCTDGSDSEIHRNS
jgi:hypothetical protein